jgi:hypothetical protein
MEYISHSDYTNMLKNFGKDTPKGLLKEALEDTGLMDKAIAAFERKFGNLTDQQKERFKQAIEMDYANGDISKMTMDDLVQIFDASVGHDDEPEPDRWDMKDIEDSDDENRFNGGDYEPDTDADYEEPGDPFDMAEELEQEGNAFTAGLAKAKKGQEFKVGAKKVKDTSNYDAPMKEMGDFSSVRARYPNNDGPFEGEMEEGPRDDDDNIPAYLRMYNSDEYVQAMRDAGEDGYATRNGDFDDVVDDEDQYTDSSSSDYYDDDRDNMWEEDKRKKGEGNKYEDLIDKLKGDGIVYDPKISSKFINDVAKAMTAVGYSDREINKSINYDKKFIPKLAKQTVKIDTGDFDDHDTDDEKQYTYSNKRGSSSRSYDDYASDMGFEEGLNAPPFKATAGTVQNVKEEAPFGLSVLSPDEQKQLKEYISSVKEIKKAIQELVGKAKNGKSMMEATAAEDEKVPAARKPVYNEPSSKPKGKPGGNRTGLVMNPAEMYEGKAKNQSLEKKVKDLMTKDKLTRREALQFIKAEKEHEQEKKGDEAKMSQHD